MTNDGTSDAKDEVLKGTEEIAKLTSIFDKLVARALRGVSLPRCSVDITLRRGQDAKQFANSPGSALSVINIPSIAVPNTKKVALETECKYFLKGLILAQNERWRRGLGMQVERIPAMGEAAKGAVRHG